MLLKNKVFTKKKPLKRLVKGHINKGGRTSSGRVTVRARGGGHKRKHRFILFLRSMCKKIFKQNFKKSIFNIPGKIASIEYNPFSSSFISLINFKNGFKAYMLTPKNAKIGDVIIYSDEKINKISEGITLNGSRIKLGNIPEGYDVYNIEMREGKGGAIARSAGTSAKVVSHKDDLTLVRLPSKKTMVFPSSAYANIGVVSNEEHNKLKL